MQHILLISGFIFLVLLIIMLLWHVLNQKAKAREQIYREAMMQESNGNYEEAIILYRKFLDMNQNENQQANGKLEEIEFRITTLRRLLK